MIPYLFLIYSSSLAKVFLSSFLIFPLRNIGICLSIRAVEGIMEEEWIVGQTGGWPTRGSWLKGEERGTTRVLYIPRCIRRVFWRVVLCMHFSALSFWASGLLHEALLFTYYQAIAWSRQGGLPSTYLGKQDRDEIAMVAGGAGCAAHIVWCNGIFSSTSVGYLGTGSVQSVHSIQQD